MPNKVVLPLSAGLLGKVAHAVGRSLDLKSISQYGLNRFDVNTALKVTDRVQQMELYNHRLSTLGLEHADELQVDKESGTKALQPHDKEVARVLESHDASINKIRSSTLRTEKKIEAIGVDIRDIKSDKAPKVVRKSKK